MRNTMRLGRRGCSRLAAAGLSLAACAPACSLFAPTTDTGQDARLTRLLQARAETHTDYMACLHDRETDPNRECSEFRARLDEELLLTP